MLKIKKIIVTFLLIIFGEYIGALAQEVSTQELPNGDVSGMFNERGYFKSNSASLDENQIISDFNGNLSYSIPITIDNPQSPSFISSREGVNEIYIANEYSYPEKSITLEHELTHV